MKKPLFLLYATAGIAVLSAFLLTCYAADIHGASPGRARLSLRSPDGKIDGSIVAQGALSYAVSVESEPFEPGSA